MRSRIRFLLTVLRRTIVGWVLIYAAVSLLLGGRPIAEFVFRSIAALWLIGLIMHAWLGRGARIFPLEAGGGRETQSVAAGSKTLHRGRLLVRGGEIVLTNLAFAVLLGELALNAHAAVTGQSLIISNSIDAYKLAPGRDYGRGLRGNKLGYPGCDRKLEKPQGIFRVAALGDSFAVGPAVAYSDNYLTQLDKKAPQTDVLNFGVSGAGPREYFTVLQNDVWQFQPDLILVNIFIGNDVTERLATPRYLDPEGHSLFLLCQRGWRLLREKQRRRNQTPADCRRHPSALSPKTFREVEARRLRVCLSPVSPRMEKKWQRVQQYLARIVSACRRRNVKVAAVLIPDEFQVNSKVWRQALTDAGVEPEQFDRTLPQRRFKQFFASRNIHCLDLLPLMKYRNDLYAPFDTHWNKEGNVFAAEAIAEWLIRTNG